LRRRGGEHLADVHLVGQLGRFGLVEARYFGGAGVVAGQQCQANADNGAERQRGQAGYAG